MQRGRLPVAMAGVALIFAGIIFMAQSQGSAPFSSIPAGALADIFPNPDSVVFGTICALLGMIAVAECLPSYVTMHGPAWEPGGRPTPRFSRAWTLARIVALAIAGPLYLVSLYGAGNHSTWPFLLLCLVLALVLLVAALAAGPGRQGLRGIPVLPRHEIAFIGAVIVAFTAIILGLVGDWHFTFWGDEWYFFSFARLVANGHAFDPFSQAGVFGIHPIADSIYQGLVMRVAGIDVTGWRLSSILATSLPIAALYAVGRQLGGPLFAATAALIYACCPLMWSFAHIGYNNDDPLLPTIAAVAFCMSGLRSGSAARLAAAGVCAGAGWYSIYTGRLVIGVLAALLVLEWRDGWSAWWKRLAWLTAGFVAAVLPLVIDNQADTVRLMSHNTPMSTTGSLSAYFTLVNHNVVRAVYAFVYSTAHDHYINGALFDPITATALLVGVSLALRRITRVESRLLLIWYVVTLAFTTPFNDADGVSITRSMVVVPPAALLAASGLCSVSAALRALVNARWRAMLPVGIAIALLAGLVANLNNNGVALSSQFYPPYPAPLLLIKAIREAPNATFVLPADMNSISGNYDGTANQNELCDVLDGYGVQPATILYPIAGTLLPYCPLEHGAIAPHATVFIFRDSAQSAAVCRIPPTSVPTLIQGAVWEYRRAIAPDPATTYLQRLRQLVLVTCPA